jgi:hypothetical protein
MTGRTYSISVNRIHKYFIRFITVLDRLKEIDIYIHNSVNGQLLIVI